jgi:DNA-binding SARP family transcriptional activator
MANLRRALHALNQILEPVPSDQRPIQANGRMLGSHLGSHCLLDLAEVDEAYRHIVPLNSCPREELGDQIFLIEQARRRYRGELLSSEDELWLISAREHYRRRNIDLLHALGTGYMRRGDTLRAMEATSELLQEAPCDEAGHVRMMRLYARAGDLGAAIRQHERLERILFNTDGRSPRPETERLRQAILASPLAGGLS